MLWQIQIIKWGGPRLIQVERSVYLLCTVPKHLGDVYRLLNPKTSRDICSRDVKWIGKMWAEFYKIKMIDRASGYVYPDEDFQLEEEEDQDIDEEESKPEEDDSEAIQVSQSQAEEPTETPVGMTDDEPVASRIRAKLKQMNQLQQEQDKHLGLTLTQVHLQMSNPDEPQSFQESWWDSDLIAREKW